MHINNTNKICRILRTDVYSQMMVGFGVYGYFEAFGHDTFEIFNVIQSVSRDKGVINVDPNIYSPRRAINLEEQADVRDASFETVLE